MYQNRIRIRLFCPGAGECAAGSAELRGPCRSAREDREPSADAVAGGQAQDHGVATGFQARTGERARVLAGLSGQRVPRERLAVVLDSQLHRARSRESEAHLGAGVRALEGLLHAEPGLTQVNRADPRRWQPDRQRDRFGAAVQAVAVNHDQAGGFAAGFGVAVSDACRAAGRGRSVAEAPVVGRDRVAVGVTGRRGVEVHRLSGHRVTRREHEPRRGWRVRLDVQLPGGGRARGRAGVGDHSQGTGACGSRAIPSYRAASCQALRSGAGGAGRGAVSRINRSSAATTAAASSGDAAGATIVSFGRRFTGAPAYPWMTAVCERRICWPKRGTYTIVSLTDTVW